MFLNHSLFLTYNWCKTLRSTNNYVSSRQYKTIGIIEIRVQKKNQLGQISMKCINAGAKSVFRLID